MKLVSLLSLIVLSLSLHAQEIKLKDYPYSMTDILARGQNRNTLFSSMNTDLIKTGSSICSNRALVWVYDFKRNYGINAAKIFLFYTGKTGRIGRKTWWYHVAPIINEGGKVWVMDPGFIPKIEAPLTTSQWFQEFVGTTKCREIRAEETDLVERMQWERTFPEYTPEYGRADCYYHIAPAGLWTPGIVASYLSGKDSEGRPIPHMSMEFDQEQVFDACVEAASTRLGRVFGDPKKKCRRYLGYSSRD